MSLYVPSFSHPRPPVINPNYIQAVLATAGPEQITNVRHVAKSFNVSGFKVDGTTPNSDSLWVGLSGTNQQWEVPAGATTNISGEGQLIAATDLYMRGTAGDGVVIEFPDGVK